MSSDAGKFEAFDVLGDGISFVRLINSMGSDVEIVNGARVSFGKRREELDEKDKVLIQYLADERHTSPFEHVAFTFHIKCPLFVNPPMASSSHLAYNEISRRYTSLNLEFYVPQKPIASRLKRTARRVPMSFWLRLRMDKISMILWQNTPPRRLIFMNH